MTDHSASDHKNWSGGPPWDVIEPTPKLYGMITTIIINSIKLKASITVTLHVVVILTYTPSARKMKGKEQ